MSKDHNIYCVQPLSELQLRKVISLTAADITLLLQDPFFSFKRECVKLLMKSEYRRIQSRLKLSK